MQEVLPELKLELAGGRFVWSESIPAKVRLTNSTVKPILIMDFDLANNPLTVNAVSGNGARLRGTLRSPLNRDGETTLPFRSGAKKRLGTGEFLEKEIDLINLLRELPEGTYKVRASYWLGGINYARSNIVMVEIVQAQPEFASTLQDYSRNLMLPIRTCWVNQDGKDRFLYLMESSNNNPISTISNMRIATLGNTEMPSPSLQSVLGQGSSHVLLQGGGYLRVIEVIGVKATECFRESFEEKLLLPAMTTEDGELRFLSCSPRDEISVTLNLLPHAGGLLRQTLFSLDGTIERHAVGFDDDCNPHLFFSSGRNVRRAKISIEKGRGEAEVSMVASFEKQVLDLHAYNDWSGNDGVQGMAIGCTLQEDGEIGSFLIDSENGKHISHTYIPLEGRRLEIMQVALDYNHVPYFLFRDENNSILFRCADSGFILIEEEGAEIGYPTLLVASKYSRRYGIYIRYISGGRFLNRLLKEVIPDV